MQGKQFTPPPIDESGNIGAPLLPSTSFSVDEELTAGAGTINVDGSKIYVTGSITGQTTNVVRRYTLTGTYESAGNLTIPSDTRPSGIPSSWIATQDTRFFRHNNNWYRSVQWSANPPTQSRYVFDRYNSSLVYQQTLWMLPINQLVNLYGFDIYNNRIYVQALTDTNVLQIRNLSNGALVSGTNSISLDFSVTGEGGSVAVTPTRIYISSGNNIIRAYNHMGSRVSADDTTLPSGMIVTDMDASGETLYVLGRTGVRGSYSYSVTHYDTLVTRTVTVAIPQGSMGAIQIALKARSFNVSGNASQVGPEFQQYLGTVYYDTGGGVDEPPSITIDGGSYCTTSRRVTWTAYVTGATESELTAFTNADTTINNVTSSGTSFTPTETVTRMPAGGSSFQIQTDPLPVDKAGDMSVTVAANALGANTNKSVTSSCVFYDTRPAGTPTVATASWGTPATQTGINAVLQGRLTFTTTTDVRGIEPGDFDVIFRDSENPPNVHVHPPAGWTIQVSHSFTNSSRDFVDVTATPTSTFDAAFGLRLKATSVRSDGATMDNAPSPDPVDSVSIDFDNRETAAPSVPQVVIGAGGFCPTSRKLTWPVSVVNASATQFAALLVDDVSITDSSTATPALTAAVVSRGSNSLIVEIEVPTERNGTASIMIAANALGMSTNTAVTSNTVSYDTRTTVSSTTITYGTPVVSNTDRDIEFPMTFTDIGDGLEASDFSISATNGVWGATLRDGTGGVQTKVLVVNNAEVFARMGTLQVTLVEDAFTNRTITGGRTSPEASYDLESTITETTVTFSNPNVSNNNRTITYTLTFSNIGAGLNTCDFSISATNGRWNLTFEYLGNHQVLVTIANSETVRRSGSLTITISENAFFNRVITGGRTSGSATYNFLASTAPRLTFSTYTTSTIRHGQRFTVYCSWSQAVTGFTQRDLSIWGNYGGIRIEEESFIGSGRAYQFVVTAPQEGDRMFISVRQGAVSPSNFPANYEIRLGGGEVTPTILNANIISGDGMTYMPDDLYTIDQTDMERPTIRTYRHDGSLRTTEQVTLGGLLENEAGQGHAIEVLDNRFVISTNRFDRFGITRASGYIEDSTTFNNLFIDVGQYNPHTSPPIPTDTAIRDLAVGGNRIFALTSDGTFESPSYQIQIYDLNGEEIRSVTVDTTTQNTKELFAVPSAIAATSRFLYLAFRTFRNPLDGTITVADELQAYTLDGVREPSEDVKIADFMGVANRFSIIGMDWDETRQRMWLIVDQIRIATDEAQRHFAYLPMPQRIDAAWSAIEPQTMRAGESLDLKPYAGDITQILFAPQSTTPDWVTLSNGVMSIASTGLPSTNTEALMSFVGISSGKPAFVSFDLTLLRESPDWETI